MRINGDVGTFVNANCRFHDVNFLGSDKDRARRNSRYPWIHDFSNVDVVNCQLGTLVFQHLDKVRIERTSLRIRSWWTRDGNHTHDTTAAILGCDLRFDRKQTFVVAKNSDFTFRGCWLFSWGKAILSRPEFAATIKVDRGQLTMNSCRFGSPQQSSKDTDYLLGRVGFDVSSGSTFRAVGCKFDYQNPISMSGQGTKATFIANDIFTGGTHSYLTVADAAVAVFRENQFRQASSSEDRAPTAVIMRGDSWDRHFLKDGIWVKGIGAGTKVEYLKNRFESEQPRPAIIMSGGATAENGGGNKFVGKSLPVKIKP